MSQRETVFNAEIRLALGKTDRHARLFRNVAGVFWGGKVIKYDGKTVTLAHAQKVATGLAPGASDLVGWTMITITEAMVGMKLAQFTSGESKVIGSGRIEKNQQDWIDAVNAAGGRAGFLWSVEDARKLVALHG
jgi:hypothetical protein